MEWRTDLFCLLIHEASEPSDGCIGASAVCPVAIFCRIVEINIIAKKDLCALKVKKPGISQRLAAAAVYFGWICKCSAALPKPLVSCGVSITRFSPTDSGEVRQTLSAITLAMFFF